MSESHLAWIALNLLSGLALRQRARLLEACGGPLDIFQSDRRQLQRAGTSAEVVANIVTFDWRSRAERENRLALAHEFHILTPASDEYPPALREIADPPPALYVQGSLQPEDQLSVAIVGSRQATPYGLEMAAEFGRDLAGRGVTVVSGLALGIDAAAHRGALEADGGRTVAVLGSGLDVPYPRRHRRLMARIAARGAVISEFPLGTPPLGWHFPLRNRILAGMTLATVVVEATGKSGSLITVRAALDAGREVLAVPGRITSSGSMGTNLLIQRGEARLALQADDVIRELPRPWGARVRPKPSEPTGVPPKLAAEERRVLGQLRGDEPAHVDALARDAGLPPGNLLDALLSLELRRLVRPLPGGRYMRAGRLGTEEASGLKS